MKSKLLANITPCEILNEEFLKPIAIIQYWLAKDIDAPPRHINEIVKDQRAITADTALPLWRYFRMSPECWLNLSLTTTWNRNRNVWLTGSTRKSGCWRRLELSHVSSWA